VGRGGWTWYTGAAGWLYRAGLESILGFHKRGSELRIDPCIPRDWKGFELSYRHGSSLYRVVVSNPANGALVPLSDDGSEHLVEVVLG
jgi:cyclic beta-1,2-glucan synthetase